MLSRVGKTTIQLNCFQSKNLKQSTNKWSDKSISNHRFERAYATELSGPAFHRHPQERTVIFSSPLLLLPPLFFITCVKENAILPTAAITTTVARGHQYWQLRK
jgi:hypothetical protein